MKKTIVTKIAALISAAGVSLVLSAGTAFAQELMTNGGFELGGVEGFGTNVPGWGVLLGGPAYTGSDYGIAQSVSHTLDVAEEGNFYAWFHASQGVADCIGETVSTLVGKQYTISFWMATDGPSPNANALALWGPSYYDN